MLKTITDNSAGPTGLVGLIIGFFPSQPKEWLIALSTLLVICQLVHWFYRFYKWCVKRRKV